jgi:hypothetical protein
MSHKGKPFTKGNIPWNLGKHHSEESIEKMRKSRRGCPAWNKGITGVQVSPNKGKHMSEEIRKKMSESCKGRRLSEETKRKIGDASRGKPLSEEHRQKIRDALMGKSLSEERKVNIGKGRKGILASAETKRKMSIVRKGRPVSQTTKKKMREVWSNGTPEYVEARLKSLLTFPSPNKSESLLMNLLEDIYPSEWKFVGDGKVFINGKCPDFININGQKKIIELFGDYWHKGQDPQDRIDVFKPFGFDTLIIWERELKHIEMTEGRIRAFCESEKAA